MDWWKLIIGIVGLVGVIGQGLSNWGSWLVGAAFLLFAVSGFFGKN